MVSIVIACYNVEKYVEEAVQSAMNQTLRDVEIICVDDCSTDGTLAKIERLAKKDARVKVVHLEKNQGLMAVRFHGLQAAGGEYVTFLDGDDYLDRNTCREALEIAKSQSVDVVQFDSMLFNTEGMSEEHLLNLRKTMAPCLTELPREAGALVQCCYVDRLFSWNLCCKLISTAVLRKAYRFYKGERLTMGEDMLGCFMALVFARGYAPLNKRYYYYRQNTGVTAASQYISVEKMQTFAQEYQVYGLLRAWLTELGYLEKYAKAVAFVKSTVYQDAYHAFAHRIYAADYAKAAQVLAQYWPPEDLAVMMSWGLYREAGWKKKAELIAALKDFDFKQKKPDQIRTVGTYYFRMYNGGVERVISKLAPIWQANGWRVVVFTDEINALDYELPEGVIRVVIPPITSDTLEDTEAHTRAWMDAIHEYRIDAMVYHGWLVKNLPEDQTAIRFAGIPMILHTHGLFSIGLGEPDIRYQYQAATQKEGYALCNEIVTLGEVDCAWWKALGYRAVRTVNPSTYELNEIEPASLEGKNVLWVGRISEQKQIYEAFRTMQRVHEKVKDAKLQIVGGAETEETMRRVRAYLKENKMEDYVSLEGFQRDVTPYYRQAALVLWTAGYEGAPMGMVEAKMFGLPIVCYELANVDMVRKAKGMYVVPQKDCVGAARHVVELLEDTALRARIGRESRESVEEMYSIDLGTHWRNILEMTMQPREAEKRASALPPMEATAQLAMEFVIKGMEYRAYSERAGVDENVDMTDRAERVRAIAELPIDGLFIKLYVKINRLFPKGGKAREWVKKIASLFLK